MRLLTLIPFVLAASCFAEEIALDRYEKAILAFEENDRQSYPKKGCALFIGSSSIVYWDSLEEDLAEWDAVNRGFGGSTLAELIHYLDRIVLPYEPGYVFIYGGSHDLRVLKGGPSAVLDRIEELSERIWRELPDTRICYLSMKPSLAKWNSIELDKQANRMISEYAAQQPNFDYIDIWNPMLAGKEKPDAALFQDDRNHLSPAGYVVWERVVREYLESQAE